MKLDNQVFLNKFTLNISNASSEGINFNKGEILKGQVQEVKENGLVSIFIKGKLIEAFSEVMVNKGQHLFLMVDDMRDGKVVLKVLTPELLNKIENANLAAILKEIGLTPEQGNLQMAKKLMQHNLPITAENLKNMVKGVNLLGEVTPKNLEITATAIANNTPVNKTALSALALFAENKSDLANLTRELLTILSKLGTGVNEPKVNLLPNTASQLRANISPNLSLATEESRVSLTNLGPNLNVNTASASVIPDSSRSASEPLLNLTNQTASIPTLSNASGIENNLAPATARILTLLNQLVNNTVLPVDTNDNQRPELIEALRTALANDKEFIRGLGLIKEFLVAQKEVPGLDKAVTSTIINTMEEMEKEFIGSRLLNVMTKLSADNSFNYYYFSFPVKVNEEYRLCQLKIDKNIGKSSLKDMDNIKFVVSLETANLGFVLFHVDWYKSKLLKLQGVVQTPEVLKHISLNINNLIEVLEEQGYTVDYQGIKVAAEKVETMRLSLQETNENVKPFAIDIRV